MLCQLLPGGKRFYLCPFSSFFILGNRNKDKKWLTFACKGEWLKAEGDKKSRGLLRVQK